MRFCEPCVVSRSRVSGDQRRPRRARPRRAARPLGRLGSGARPGGSASPCAADRRSVLPAAYAQSSRHRPAAFVAVARCAGRSSATGQKRRAWSPHRQAGDSRFTPVPPMLAGGSCDAAGPTCAPEKQRRGRLSAGRPRLTASLARRPDGSPREGGQGTPRAPAWRSAPPGPRSCGGCSPACAPEPPPGAAQVSVRGLTAGLSAGASWPACAWFV